MVDETPRRPVRSYVLRTGRMTAAQQQALDHHWSRWGLEHAAGLLKPAAAFGRIAPLTVEIGFGMGQSLLAMAQADPEADFLGIEVHPPGVGRLLHSMAESGTDNIRVYRHDAVDVLRDCLAPQTVDQFQIYFPDPWHKKRHHKRRLIQPAFVELLVSRLTPTGGLHLATDWEDYAGQMMEVLSGNADLVNVHGPGQFAPRPHDRPVTRFERRGERLGHGVWDLQFRRASLQPSTTR